jgi:UDPglucose 6-dehydrogenase
VGKLLKDPVVVDLRNMYVPDEMAAAGLRYTGIGRGHSAVPSRSRG